MTNFKKKKVPSAPFVHYDWKDDYQSGSTDCYCFRFRYYHLRISGLVPTVTNVRKKLILKYTDLKFKMASLGQVILKLTEIKLYSKSSSY